MISRDDVLRDAVDKCMKELYSLVTPSVKWDDFVEQNKIYSKLYKEWEEFRLDFINKEKNPKKWEETKGKYKNLEWEGKSFIDCIGPRPYEFYYLPKEIMNDVCNYYIEAYRLDSQQELLNTIEILKHYCREPIVDKYIDGKNGEPGHRGYDHPDNLEKEIKDLLKAYCDDSECDFSYVVNEIVNKFFEFLDMAGNFYNWNGELNSFNTSVYLGASPNSNKEAVIKNWKKYKNKDITIDEEQIKKDYYGDDE